MLAHHPYSVGSPRRKAVNADDVSIPDMGKLTRLLRAAERTGGALPRRRHRLWVTEIAYDSSPPDPYGVPAAQHARYLEEAFFLLWRQGVDTITWYQISDGPPLPSYAASSQSGIYLADGRPKIAQRAFEFPFVAERANRTTIRVWGRSPIAGSLRIQRHVSNRWITVRKVRVKRHATFFVRIAGRRPSLRARVGDRKSLIWRVR